MRWDSVWAMDRFKEGRKVESPGICRSMSQWQEGKLKKREEQRKGTFWHSVNTVGYLCYHVSKTCMSITRLFPRIIQKSIKSKIHLTPSFIKSVFVSSLFISSGFRFIPEACVQLEHLRGGKVQDGHLYVAVRWFWLLDGAPWFQLMCLFSSRKLVQLSYWTFSGQQKQKMQGLLRSSLAGCTVSLLFVKASHKAQQDSGDGQIDAKTLWKERQSHTSRRYNSLGPILLSCLTFS